MRQFVLILFLLATQLSFAGGEGHGSNHLKTRLLWAREMGLLILKSPSCNLKFSQSECETMLTKLTRSSFVWLAKDSKDLKVTLNGVEQTVTFRTTTELDSVIEVDLNRAEALGPLEAISTMVHEAGHAVGLSDDLTTDRRVIAILTEDPQLRSLFMMLQTWGNQGEKGKIGPEIQYYKTWSERVTSTLTLTLKKSFVASTLAQEKSLLISGIEQVLEFTQPEHRVFVLWTLDAAQSDVKLFDDLAPQIRILRRAYTDALEDMRVLPSLVSDPQSLGFHMTGVLKRAQLAAIQAGSRAEEVSLLKNTLQRLSGFLSIYSSKGDSQLAQMSDLLEANLSLARLPENLSALRQGVRQVQAFLGEQSHR